MDDPTLIFRVLAIQRMFERGISEVEVRAVLQDQDVIEDYPDDLPYPSKLLLGWLDQRPLHVVASFIDPHTIIVISVYEPDPARWEPGFRKRKP